MGPRAENSKFKGREANGGIKELPLRAYGVGQLTLRVAPLQLPVIEALDGCFWHKAAITLDQNFAFKGVRLDRH